MGELRRIFFRPASRGQTRRNHDALPVPLSKPNVGADGTGYQRSPNGPEAGGVLDRVTAVEEGVGSVGMAERGAGRGFAQLTVAGQGRRGRKRATDFYCSSRALKSSNWARVATPTGSDVAVTSLHSHARLRRRVQRPARGRGDAGGEGPSHGGRHPSTLRGPPVTVACTPWLVPHHVRSIRCRLFRSNGL